MGVDVPRGLLWMLHGRAMSPSSLGTREVDSEPTPMLKRDSGHIAIRDVYSAIWKATSCGHLRAVGYAAGSWATGPHAERDSESGEGGVLQLANQCSRD